MLMGSIFSNTPARRVRTVRQQRYVQGKKTDRKVVKHELQMQVEFCNWFRDTFPGVHFRCDTSAGGFSSEWEKNLDSSQRSARGLPDFEAYAARRGYHGLLLELKTDDAKLKRKRDATKMWVRKNSSGKIMERDYKLRKAGDWYDPHIERQAMRIQELREAGYCAAFGKGLDRLKKIACWYMGVEYALPPENAELF
jgi:hypothetical protein